MANLEHHVQDDSGRADLLTGIVVGMAQARLSVGWVSVFLLSLLLALFGLGFSAWQIASDGVGVLGVSNNVPWGLDIVHFVFWIGLGHAGTLISSVLLLTGQHWRSPIARGAELMTLCAVVCAAVFPIVHVGRIWMVWMASPLPDVSGVWPDIGSPLMWDVLAVTTYFSLSAIYWYIGLLPDLALLRDRCCGAMRKRVYGLLSLGWFGSSRQWSVYERASLLMAAVLAPLVVSVHSVVSFDFSSTQIPGWHETIFPPYFVAGAIFSGMAMVQLILLVIRVLYAKGVGMLIDRRLLGMTSRFVLGLSWVMTLMYFWEHLIAFLNGGTGKELLMGRMQDEGWFFCVMVLGNVLLPQLYWVKRWRSSIPVVAVVAVAVLAGMWCERWLIVISSLQKGWRSVMDSVYVPSPVDWWMGAGSIGLFVALYMVLVRVTPFFSLCDMRRKGTGCAIPEEKSRNEREVES